MIVLVKVPFVIVVFLDLYSFFYSELLMDGLRLLKWTG